jgi:two-component system sensor histidine kinase DegS
MESTSSPSRNQPKRIVSSRSFWILAAMLVGLGLIHYLTAQQRFLPLAPQPMARHAVERIIFILPVAGATFAFGQAGGIVALASAVLIMLPRALFISPYPADALMEIVAVGIVGYLVIWMIETQEREKRLRQETASRLRTINAVTAMVTGSLELAQILNSALDKVLEVTKVQTGSIYLLDTGTQELVLATCRGLSPRFAHDAARFKLGESLTGWVGRSGEPMVVDDLLQEPRLTTGLATQEGMQSFIAVPLKARGEVLGVMTLADPQHHRFTLQDLQLLTSIGNQIGVATENAQLHQDVARQLRVQQRLNEVAEEITSELELDRILPKVLQIAEDLIDADGGVIALFDQQSDLIRYPYIHNLPGELKGVAVPKEEGLAAEVMTTSRPIVIRDYRTYPRAIPAFVEAGVTSVVGVPIVSGDQSFGTLALVSLDEARDFSDRDIAVLSGIGRQAGIAIENARLYENLRFYIQRITVAQEDERKRIARELHDETIQMLIVVSRRLEVLATLPENLPETATRHLESLQELIGRTLREVRRFVQDLRPPTLDYLGLVATLEGLTDDLKNDAIATELSVTGETRRLLPEEELMLFRIAQEALNNVRRHAQASRAVVQLEFCPGKVRMIVDDNGRGFNAPERMGDLVSSGRLGLVGMYERARTLGGTLTIQSELGRGTVVIVDVPVQSEAESAGAVPEETGLDAAGETGQEHLS